MWADEGFVRSIHDAAYYHDLYFLDWWDVAKFYSIFVCVSAFDIFLLHEIPKWVKFVAIVGVVPAVIVLSLMCENDRRNAGCDLQQHTKRPTIEFDLDGSSV
jgi:hypothetical protein